MPGKIIAIANQKGGVGKSTTCQYLGQWLKRLDKKVLVIDLDPQSNLSILSGANTDATNVETKTILEVLCNGVTADGVPFSNAIQHLDEYDIVPASMFLAGIDGRLTDPIIRTYKFKTEIANAELTKLYDYILIDCPPALGTLTTLALIAANTVIVPAQADVLSLQGVSQLFATIESIRNNNANKALKIEGILLTRFKENTTMSREMSAMFSSVTSQMGTKLFETKIHDSTAVPKSQGSKKSIFDTKPLPRPAEDYINLVREIFNIE